jgi:hypothetical protein
VQTCCKQIMKYFFFFLLFIHSLNTAAQTGCFSKKDATLSMDTETSVFNNTDAVMVGEFHGVLGAYEVKLSLIKHLNTYNSYRDLFMEVGSAAAYLYNQYLSTGDTSFITNPSLPYAIKAAEKQFWKELYDYNKGLPPSNKVIIHGVDFERIEFLKVLKLLLQPNKSNAYSKELLSTCDSLLQNVKSYKENNKIYEKYKAYYNNNKEVLQQLYGDNYSIMAQILGNPTLQSDFGRRNETMHQNIVSILKSTPIEKFIGFFGLNHTNSGKSNSLVGMLSTNDRLKGRIVTLAMLCKNCYDWQQFIKYAAYSGPYTYQRDEALIDHIFKTFYKGDCKYTLIPSSATGNKKVTEFSNYLILFKDQPEFN